MWSKKIKFQDGNMLSVATSLVLLAIDQLSGDTDQNSVYGYQIMQHLRERFNWNVKSGTVYPILKKLSSDHLIRQIKDKSGNRQQVYYHITPTGIALVKKIESLNDDSLDAALTADSESDSADLLTSETNLCEPIPILHLADSLGKVLFNMDKQIAEFVNEQRSIEELEQIKDQLSRATQQLEVFQKLFDTHITRVKTYLSTKR